MHTAAKSSGPKGTTQCGIWGALGEERLRVRAAGLVASSDLGLGLPTSLRLAVLILEVSAVGSSRSTRAGQWAQLMAAVGLLGLKKVGMHFTTVSLYIEHPTVPKRRGSTFWRGLSSRGLAVQDKRCREFSEVTSSSADLPTSDEILYQPFSVLHHTYMISDLLKRNTKRKCSEAGFLAPL